jgi:hypothetical protein
VKAWTESLGGMMRVWADAKGTTKAMHKRRPRTPREKKRRPVAFRR